MKRNPGAAATLLLMALGCGALIACNDPYDVRVSRDKVLKEMDAHPIEQMTPKEQYYYTTKVDNTLTALNPDYDRFNSIPPKTTAEWKTKFSEAIKTDCLSFGETTAAYQQANICVPTIDNLAELLHAHPMKVTPLVSSAP